jgi:DNA-binding CsgD family transcriptional regulator
VLLELVCSAVARARLGQTDLAVTLAHAAENLRQEIGFAPLPVLTSLGAEHLCAAEASLGPSATERARRRGAGLDLTAAVDLACSPVPTPQAGPLSSREAEVMRLVARGLDNREIADLLGISLRTVDAHLSHVRTKLGVSFRPALVRWAIDHDLGTDIEQASG